MKEVIIPENLLGLDPNTCESYHQGDLNRMVKKQIKCIELIWTVYSVYFSPSAGKSPQVWISGTARQASPTKVFNRHEKQWGWPSVAEDCDLKTSNNGDPCGGQESWCRINPCRLGWRMKNQKNDDDNGVPDRMLTILMGNQWWQPS